MDENGIVGVYTTPARTKVIHVMLQEDGTTKKMEETYEEYVKRGEKPPKEFQYWKRKRKQSKKQK